MDPAHVFIDDAVSRAEFKKRRGLPALLLAVEAGLVDVVVMRDETRLGGDMIRTGLVIQQVIEAGASLRYYFTDEVVHLDGATDRFLVAARNFAAELEREKISQRTHEHHMVKARRGLVVGGRCFGYDNVEAKDDQGRRVRVEYVINESQAEVIREVFRRYANGEGLRGIAKSLNERGVPSPSAGKRGTGSWSGGAIYEILHRERYRGVIVWNRYEKTYRGGTKVRIERPEAEWLRMEAPHLRIVEDDVWDNVQARFHGRSEEARRRRRPGRPPRYLLTSLARCSVCGGPIGVANGRQGKAPIKVYGCTYHRERGSTVCANSLRRPMEAVDEVVVAWIRRHVLTEDVVVAVLREVRLRLRERAREGESELPQLAAEVRKREQEIKRLVDILASADTQPEAVLERISERENEVRSLKTRLEVLRTAPSVIDMEVQRIEAEARRRLANLRSLLERNPDQAREVMSTILDGPLSFTPIRTDDGPRYEVRGSIGLGKLVVTDRFSNSASPAGFEPHFRD